jgi:hypothetical protein
MVQSETWQFAANTYKDQYKSQQWRHIVPIWFITGLLYAVAVLAAVISSNYVDIPRQRCLICQP